MSHLLIIDDDANTLASLSRAFRMEGYEVTVADHAARALELVGKQIFDLIFSDVVMPDKDGVTLLEEMRAAGVTSPVVMMSGQATVDMAVRATKLGAIDFLEKPLSTERLLLTVENALRLKRLERENSELRARIGRHEIIWRSEAMRRVMAQVARVAAGESRVCILGETGTGKELIARAIHNLSARCDNAFVKLNCASIPTGLLESELFGHERGAFTGAIAQRIGRFELANRGTIFLDEIGEVPLELQPKLLRVLQEREFERLGSSRTLRSEARLIAATNRDLSKMVEAQTFRADLFYRLNVIPIWLPALRERPEDVPLLVQHFAELFSRRMNKAIQTIPSETMSAMVHYDWPGNVRELQNVIERAVILSTGGVLKVPLGDLRSAGHVVKATVSRRSDAAPPGRDRVIEALREAGGRVGGATGAAARLGMKRTTLIAYMKRLSIDPRTVIRPSLTVS